MTIEEVKQLSYQELTDEIEKGGHFVVYTFTISLILVTFRNPSDIYFLRKGEFAFKHGFPYFLLSMLLGWWGIPYGPIYTVQSIWHSIFPKRLNPNEVLPYNIYQPSQE